MGRVFRPLLNLFRKDSRREEAIVEERATLTVISEGVDPIVEYVYHYPSGWQPNQLSTLYHVSSAHRYSIVAVHGLNGDAFKSFTAAQTNRFWLRDRDMLPQDLHDRCRVLTFSYPATVASILGRASSESIRRHAVTLVAELVANREVCQ